MKIKFRYIIFIIFILLGVYYKLKYHPVETKLITTGLYFKRTISNPYKDYNKYYFFEDIIINDQFSITSVGNVYICVNSKDEATEKLLNEFIADIVVNEEDRISSIKNSTVNEDGMTYTVSYKGGITSFSSGTESTAVFELSDYETSVSFLKCSYFQHLKTESLWTDDEMYIGRAQKKLTKEEFNDLIWYLKEIKLIDRTTHGGYRIKKIELLLDEDEILRVDEGVYHFVNDVGFDTKSEYYTKTYRYNSSTGDLFMSRRKYNYL